MAQSLELNIKTTSDVPAAMDKATTATRSFGRSVDSVKGKANSAFGGMAAKLTSMFGAAVLFDRALGFMSNTFTEFGKVADQVDRSGISSEDFQRLSYAAGQSGVSISALAKATRQLRVDMAEAAAGTGKKVEMFQALGISMNQLKSGDASTVFLAISKAIGESADDSERLLISTAFFGDKIGNDILPLLSDYRKLSKDIADSPIVDAKTLKLIGDYNDGMDRITAKMKVFVAYIFSAYDAYSKFISKIAEGFATFGFNVTDSLLPNSLKGTAAKAASAGIKYNPLTGPLVALGADGTVKTRAAEPTNNGGATKALLAAIAGTAKGAKGEQDKADLKQKSNSTNATSVSGNVIGVGANPVVTALQEQQAIAREQLACLQVIASKSTDSASGDVTASGAVPSTPANAAMNRSPIVTKNK